MSYWKHINYNKWKQNMPDCPIRAVCAGLGFDYEEACKKLGVKCVKGKGFTDTYGVDLDQIIKKFRTYLSPLEEIYDMFDEPMQALTNGITLEDWLMTHEDDNALYLVHLADTKVADGGHIIFARCQGDKTYFIDTFDMWNATPKAFIFSGCHKRCQIE